MLPQFTTAQYIQDFLNGILKDAGMDKVDAEVKQQMMEDLKNRLEDRLFGSIIINLKEEDLTKFRKLVDGKETNQKQVEEFINIHIPNSTEVFAQAMVTFRNDYLGV